MTGNHAGESTVTYQLRCTEVKSVSKVIHFIALATLFPFLRPKAYSLCTVFLVTHVCPHVYIYDSGDCLRIVNPCPHGRNEMIVNTQISIKRGPLGTTLTLSKHRLPDIALMFTNLQPWNLYKRTFTDPRYSVHLINVSVYYRFVLQKIWEEKFGTYSGRSISAWFGDRFLLDLGSA